MVEDPRRPGKFKKVKKQIPAYIPEQDAMVLASVRKLAYRLDMSLFNFMGIRFGWEAVIGIVPMFGDVVGVLFALIIWRKCQKIDGGLDSTTSIRMLINIALDFAIGLVPILGDLADAAFKCNTKNARLLELHLDRKYRARAGERDDRDLVGVDHAQRRKNRQSGIYHREDPPPATAFEDFSDEDEDRQQYLQEQRAADGVRQPKPTRAPEGRKSSGWFSGARSGDRRTDTEMAQTPGRGESAGARP